MRGPTGEDGLSEKRIMITGCQAWDLVVPHGSIGIGMNIFVISLDAEVTASNIAINIQKKS